MKAEQEKPDFKPVVLTLETQAEVDAIYAVLNNQPLCDILGFNNDEFECLKEYRNYSACKKMHQNILSALK